MNLYYRILAGALIGLALGAVNYFLMRTFVHMALQNAGRVRGVIVIILSYGVRYLLIFLVLYWLMNRNEQMMALIVLVVLGAMLMLFAALQQRKERKEKSDANR